MVTHTSPAAGVNEKKGGGTRGLWSSDSVNTSATGARGTGEEAKDAASTGSTSGSSAGSANINGSEGVKDDGTNNADMDPGYFDRLLGAYVRLWERDITYHGLRVMVQRSCLLSLGEQEIVSRAVLIKLYVFCSLFFPPSCPCL
jgi:hypothetical protein